MINPFFSVEYRMKKAKWGLFSIDQSLIFPPFFSYTFIKVIYGYFFTNILPHFLHKTLGSIHKLC